ncbi:class I SAM-dependent methyltransferase [Consotaella salsifontis]|uniref:Methyltransferase domain-containing protein n=1 Tax=Consotaella salsifontis TaxID=1365950 RepID=A0A1T4QNP5_9HYPH|nr:class I SAM-dependent methyltransferase [Consotaella salsifontis]SKA05393.1 Methyltransferase domain-containing protein [Consotaella salsifontis]
MPSSRVLDCGCGSGHAGLATIIDAGTHVTALDGSSAMLALFLQRYPGVEAVRADMLVHEPDGRFDGILAWDSFFHLDHDDQVKMIARFADWLAPGGLLMLTTGPGHSTVISQMFGVDFSYGSFSGAEYRSLFKANDLLVEWDRLDEPGAAIHRVWLLRKAETEL